MEMFGKYEADIRLSNWVNKIQKSAIYEIIVVGLFFGFLILAMIVNEFSAVLFSLILIMLMALFVVFVYGGTIRRAKVVNNTIRKITATENTLKIVTFDYNMLYIRHYKEKVFEIDKGNANLSKCDYPIMDKKIIENPIFCLKDKDEEYYIINKYFDIDLKNSVMSMGS